MGRAKHCTQEKREIILNMLESGKSYKYIQNSLNCSAKMIINAKNWCRKPEKRGGKKKTTTVEDRRIMRCVKIDPFVSSSQIKTNLNLDVSTSTIRRRLISSNLRARRPRKVPLLNKKQIQKRLHFAKEHEMWPSSKWRNILWTDESKIVLFNPSIHQQRVRRPPNTEYNPKYTTKTIKHGSCSVMVWGCFSWFGVGPIYWIKDIMTAGVYVHLLENVMLPFAEEEMPLKWVFQQDNDPKHTSRRAKAWFAENNIDVMVWPSQSPDLNPIENLWADVKKAVSLKRPSNKEELWRVVEIAWKSIDIDTCKKLVNSMPRRCEQVIRNKGFSTKY